MHRVEADGREQRHHHHDDEEGRAALGCAPGSASDPLHHCTLAWFGSATSALLRLLDDYGARALEVAVAETLAHDTPHPHAVRHVLERRRRQQGEPPPIAVTLPSDPRVRRITVRPHRLNDYDHIEPKESKP